MTDYSTQAPVPNPRPQLYLDEVLTGLTTLLVPTTVFFIIILLIYIGIESIHKWIKPYFRHKRTEQLLSGTHELDKLYTAPGHHTI